MCGNKSAIVITYSILTFGIGTSNNDFLTDPYVSDIIDRLIGTPCRF
jgi:hypothetical protein